MEVKLNKLSIHYRMAKKIVKKIEELAFDKYENKPFNLSEEIYSQIEMLDPERFPKEKILKKLGKPNIVTKICAHVVNAFDNHQGVEINGNMIRFVNAEEIDVRIKDVAADISEAIASNGAGYIYAYTKASVQSFYKNEAGETRIKIGRTIRDPHKRIKEQFGTSECEQPIVLKTWRVEKHASVESLIHKVLSNKGKRVSGVSGTEWFTTSIEEIEKILSVNKVI